MIRKSTQSLVASRSFNAAVCVVILAALLIVLPMKTLPDLSERAVRMLYLAEWAVIILFTVEFALRLVDGGRRYLFGWGIVELLVIGPYYLDALGLVSVDNSEVLRVVRLLLLLKFVRPFVGPIRRMWKAFMDVGPEIGVFLIIVLLLVYCAGVVFYGLEQDSNPAIASLYDALWWAVVTLSTLGYGDITPVTAAGRIVAGFLIVMGVLVVAIPAGLLASELVTHSRNRRSHK